MDNKPGFVPRMPQILLEVPHEGTRRRCNSLSKVQDEEEVQRTTKKRSFRKTLTRTWSKRISFRSKSIEIRSAPNGSPVKTPEERSALLAHPENAVLRVRGRSRERRSVSMEPGTSSGGVGSKIVRPTCINLLVTGTTEVAALFPVDNRNCLSASNNNNNNNNTTTEDNIKKSTDDVGGGHDLEDLRQQYDPALLNGSSSNFGSAGARSAPSTPQTTSIGPSLLSSVLSDCNPGTSPPNSLPRSPSHNIFSKFDKGNIKQLSTSAPIMTAQAQSPEPPSPKGSKETKPIPYKARQKKFHRHFPAALQDDVLNYYSCALIGDILLQGHLYITKNYFAFYSNVFGYVTKLLIPMPSVVKITKERTARIIPNAVGITTCDDKHVFGSLISRDATYKYMNQVWETAKKEICDEIIIPSPPPSELTEHVSDDLSESSETREESGRDSASDVTSRFRKCTNKPTESYVTESKAEKVGEVKQSLFKEAYLKFASANRQNLLLYVTTFILIILFLSAAVLLYRIGQVQNRYTQALHDNFVMSDSDDVYGELLQWQTHLHSKSAGAVHSFLDTNLDQIAKVRQSLEALSTLLIPNGHSAGQTTATNPIDTENS